MKNRFFKWNHCLMLLIAFTLFSCKESSKKHSKKVPIRQEIICNKEISLKNKLFSKKDKEVQHILDFMNLVDHKIKKNQLLSIENSTNKFGTYSVYGDSLKNIKIISEVYVNRLKLASIKHEIYFADDCNCFAKMTKYAYRSKRIKAIYYFSFHKDKYLGCLVETVHSIFRKKDKWMDISDEKIAKEWSSRIYNNIIKQHLIY